MTNRFADIYSFITNHFRVGGNSWTFRLLVLCFLLCPLSISAQRVKKVSGEYTYYAEGHESVNEAKIKALEGAKMQAIADKFGTVISQSTSQSESVDDGVEHSFFSQLSSTEVKGEWLENLKEPEYTISYVDNMLVVKCKVSGNARETSNKAAEFEATILRNHPELRDADVHFESGNDMFLHFDAPSNGYVAVYLVDETPKAYCLLPYKHDTDGQQKVKGGLDYIFFSPDKALEEKELVDEYKLHCAENSIERNKVYVIYSKKPFTKAADHEAEKELMPRELKYEDFEHWLGRQRAHDPEMGVKVMWIDIKK